MRQDLTREREAAGHAAARRRLAGAAILGLAMLGYWLLRAAGAW